MKHLIAMTAVTALLAACSGAENSTTPPPTVATVTVSGPDSMLFGQTTTFTATPRDASGNALAGRSIIWKSSNPGIATVSVAGNVVVVDTGAFSIRAESEGVSGQLEVVGWSLVFVGVSASDLGTCGLTAAGRPWCWGGHVGGELPAPLGDGRAYASVTGTVGRTCGRTVAGEALCWTDPASGAVSEPAGPVWAQVAPGPKHNCGLTAAGEVLCWGENGTGRLGTGLITASPTPLPVAGGEHYSELSSGTIHSCAVTLAGVGMCWGSNGNGQLGVDSIASNAYAPVPVDGGLTFRTIAAGNVTSCGITPDDGVYCWGDNAGYTLGNNSSLYSTVPVPVYGGFKAKVVTHGNYFSCGLTPAGAAWCWGNNDLGQLGNGNTASDSIPVPVAGGHSFTQLSAGFGAHVCGLTQAGEVYCWGSNGLAQLGRPGRGQSNVPVKVLGQR